MKNAKLKPHYPVVIVGGGQAGLSVSYYLSEQGTDHMVFEKETMAHKWSSQRWDAFCLVTPNWQCKLPDFPYQGPDKDGFMVREEILDYLKGFIEKVKPPISEHTQVHHVRRTARGFAVETSAGNCTADAVVLATSLYAIPVIPRPADRLPSEVLQIHSADYRSSAQLPGGKVMVVGSGQSGCQIAEDLHLAGREVHLVTGEAPRCARFYRGRDVTAWLWDMGHYELTIAHDGMGGKKDDTNHYLTGRDGGRDIDLRKFALEGMKLYGRMTGVDGSTMQFRKNLKENLDNADRVYNGINAAIDRFIEANGINAPAATVYEPIWEPENEVASIDLLEEGITSVIWATGFRPDWGYADLPVFNGAGEPVHRRGVTAVPGAYLVGLPWLWTWGSGRFLSVADDAKHIAGKIRDQLNAAKVELPEAV